MSGTAAVEPAVERAGGGRVAGLDGVRGVAILIVLVHHFGINARAPWWMERVFQAGWVGVDLFFVLSGFLITEILLESKGSGGSGHFFRNFYARRVLRIFPLYYGVVAACVMVAVLDAGSRGLLREQGWLWLYGTNIKMALVGDWFFRFGRLDLRHLWSLAIEEHFYLVWPAVVLVIGRRGLGRVCVGVIVGALILRLVAAHERAFFVMHVLTPCRIDSMAAGGLLAVLWREELGREWLRRWMPVIGAGCLIVIAIIALREKSFYPMANRWGAGKYTLLAGMFAWVVWYGAGDWRGILRWGTLRRLGKYSYGVYMFHPLVQGVLSYEMFAGWMGTRWWTGVVFALSGGGVSFLAAYGSWHLYEKHFLKLKRFFPR